MKSSLVVLATALTLCLSRSESAAKKLIDLIPGLYGGDGIILGTDPAASHHAHFVFDTAARINQLNEQIVAEIGVFPFSSSVGGFTFALDTSLGTFVRTTETLGPLFAERAQTLGRGKLNVHGSYTFFKYDEFSGDDLGNLQVTARHQPDVIGLPDVREQFELDTIRISVDLDIRVQIFSLAATYGLTDRLDIGIFVPIVHVDMEVKSVAQIIVSPQNTLFSDVHFFDPNGESPNDSASGQATGFGDIVLRAKYLFLKSQVVDIAGAMLVKLATGDEKDFLGTGDTTVRPFLALSRTFSDFLVRQIMITPHLNIGYEFNVDRHEQNAVEYVVGFDAGTSRFVVAGEFIGSHELNGDGLGDNILTASIGVKWNPWKQLLLAANAQLPLNDAGLRSKLILTFGAEYNF
jgi:hypothetical protein